MYVKCFESSTSTKGVTGIMQRHGRRRPVAQRTVIRPVASNTAIGLSTRRLPFSASPWSTVKGWMTTWGEDTRRQCQSDVSPLVHREVVDDDLRRGHEKTVPIRLESPGLPWSGGWPPEGRTREDSANQTWVPWSTVKWWTTTWGVRGHCIGNRRTPTR